MLDDFGEGSRKQGFIADSMLSGSRSNSMTGCNSLETQKHTHAVP